MKGSTSTESAGFALLGALFILTLCSILAATSATTSRELINSTQNRNELEKVQLLQWEELIAAPQYTTSDETVNPHPARDIKKLNALAKSVFQSSTKNSFPLLYDWQRFAELPELNCSEQGSNPKTIFSSKNSCRTLDTLNRAVSGNLELSRLEIADPDQSESYFIIKGDFKIDHLLISTHKPYSLSIVALGEIEIGELIVDTSSPVTLLLYSESSPIRFLNELAAPSLCIELPHSSNLKVVSLSPAGTWSGTAYIPSKITAKCAKNSLSFTLKAE